MVVMCSTTMYANSEDFQVLAITTMVSSFVAEWNDQKYEITSQKGGYIKVFSCGSAGILAARNCAMLVGDLLVNHM